MDRDDPVHAREIDGNSAARRIEVPLQRRPGAERDDRRAVRSADPHDFPNFRGVLGKNHRVRRLVRDPAGRMAVLAAHGFRLAQPLPEPLFEDGYRERNPAVVTLRSRRAGHR
jgi:hypothetical protein